MEFKVNQKRLGELLRSKLDEGYKMKSIAEAIGVDRGTLYKLVRQGEVNPTFKIETISLFSQYFEVPVEELLEKKNDMGRFCYYILTRYLEESDPLEVRMVAELLKPMVDGKKKPLLHNLKATGKTCQLPMKAFLYMLTNDSYEVREDILRWIREMDQRDLKSYLMPILERMSAEANSIHMIRVKKAAIPMKIEYETLRTGEYCVYLPDLEMDSGYQSEEPLELYVSVAVDVKDEQWEADMRKAIFKAAEDVVYDCEAEEEQIGEFLEKLADYTENGVFWSLEEDREKKPQEFAAKAASEPYDPFSKENINRTAAIVTYLKYEMERDGCGDEFPKLLVDSGLMDEACRKYGIRNPYLG